MLKCPNSLSESTHIVDMTLFAFLRCYIPILTFWGIFGPKIPGLGPKMHTSVMEMSTMLSNSPFYLPHRPDDYTSKRKKKVSGMIKMIKS